MSKPSIFERARNLLGAWGGGEISAATEYPADPPPKAKRGQVILPSFLTTSKPNPNSALIREDKRLYNTDLTTLRQGTSTFDTIRKFVKSSPDLSAAVTSYIRTAVTDQYTGAAKNMDGTFNPEATSALAQVITRMNVLNDYTIGYDDSYSLRAIAEVWGKEMLQYGGMAGELVLNKALLPDKFQPVSVSQIRLHPSSDGKKVIPHQLIAGQDISLDIPTFFMVTLDQDLLTPYSESPIESAIQGVLFSLDFMNDIRRIVKRAIHPRLTCTIDWEKLKKTIPPDVLNDQAKMTEYLGQIVSDLETKINGLNPEDALILLDTVAVDVIDHGNTDLSNELTVLQGLADAKLRSGAKAMPTVVGMASGTSNVASTEALMFVKFVEGAVWGKLNEMFSKMFTLAVRLLGHDVYVEFSLAPIDLRPKSELETFAALKQSRVLELLSLGLLSDEEASLILTGHLPPPGAPKLSGTMFFQTKAAGAGDGSTNDGSTLNQNLKSKAPDGGARGQNKKADVVPLHGVLQ
jgi:hypothetical protein